MTAIPRQRRASIGEKAVDTLRGVEQKLEHALLCMWDDLQHWQQDNHYIISGYRPATQSFKKSFASLSYFHNESVNIYTHLLGSLLFLALLLYLHSVTAPRYATATIADIIAFSTFFASAATCMGMSATYHTISNHSPSVSAFGNQLDYLGIVILIVGSFLPEIYYGFLCRPVLIVGYMAMMAVLGLICAVITMTPRFRTPPYRPFRAGMFVALGLSGVLPVTHGVVLFGWNHLVERMGLWWVIAEGAMYILGAGIYAARVPEKFWPGRFDMVGASHQIFHCFVVAAALAHFRAMMVAFDYLHVDGGMWGDRC